MDLSGKRIALALGGGGARGCAHLGAIDELEARGAEIVAVSGTSMGALIGGMYAADQFGPYREWLEGLTYRDVLRMLDPALRSPGLIGADKIMHRVRELIGDTQIEQLRIPFTAVATELMSGQEVWFQQGSLAHAIRASIAIPSVITPLIEGERVLVDGGLVDLVPVMPLASAHADLMVAVSVIGPRQQPETTPVTLSTLDVVELSIQTMQRMITRLQMASFPPDVYIELAADICGTMDFHRATELAEMGRAAAKSVLDAMPD